MKHILPLIAASALCISTASAHPTGEPSTQNETAMTTHTLTSKYSFDETVSRLETAIKAKEWTFLPSLTIRKPPAETA